MALGQILTQSGMHNEPFTAPMARPVGATVNSQPPSLSKNLNRLVSAAVVSPHFRHLLFSDPVAALAAGYNGENFQLNPAEYAAVTSLHVNTVREFATQLLHRLQYAPYTTGESAPAAPDMQAERQLVEVAAQVLDSGEQSALMPRRLEMETPHNRRNAARPARHLRGNYPAPKHGS